MRWKVESGVINIMLGSSCNDIRLKDKFTIKSDEFITSETRELYSYVNHI